MLRYFGAPVPNTWRSAGLYGNSDAPQESTMSASHPSPQKQDLSMFSASLAETDPELAEAIRLELGRQRDEIELIASENIVSKAVLEAQGSELTNKNAEGQPGKRYYGGVGLLAITPGMNPL